MELILVMSMNGSAGLFARSVRLACNMSANLERPEDCGDGGFGTGREVVDLLDWGARFARSAAKGESFSSALRREVSERGRECKH